MAFFTSLHFVPVTAPDSDLPESPDLEAFAERRTAAKRTFLRQLVDHADEPFVGMQWDVPGFGRIVIQMDIIQHTAALVTIGRVNAGENEACSLIMTAVLLSGFREADDAALEALSTTSGFCDNPHLGVDAYEPVKEAARPLMAQCFVTPESYTSPHLRALVEALADAFFDQFGSGSEESEGDAGEDRAAA